MSAEELLPCPFCGVSDHLSAIKTGSAAGHYYPYAVVCRHLDCDDVRGPTGNGKHEAIAAWNRRTPPAMSADHIGEATNMIEPVAALSSKPVDDTGEANSSVKFPVEAVAWRWLPLLKGKKEPWMEGDATPWVYRTGSAKPDFSAFPAGDIIDLQPLYAHPAPIRRFLLVLVFFTSTFTYTYIYIYVYFYVQLYANLY